MSFQSSVHDQYRTSTHSFDKSQLQKLDSRRTSEISTRSETPPRSYPRSPYSTSAHETSPTSQLSAFEARHPPQLKPLSVPDISHPPTSDSPFSHWASGSVSAVSPRNLHPFSHPGAFDFRSPSDAGDSDRSPIPRIRRSPSGSVLSAGDDNASVASQSNRGSYDHGMFRDDDDMDDSRFKRLNIDDNPLGRSGALSPRATAGVKRRALSPPHDDGSPALRTVGSASELFQRRVSASRISPGPPRFHSHSASISSTSSGPRNGSYASTLSLAASSITSMNSYGRLSPGGLSPGGLSPSADGSDSPYAMSLNPSPRSSVSTPKTPHQRALSDTRPLMTTRKLSDGVGHVKHHSTSKLLHGIYMCECCPKKPKKFETAEELTYVDFFFFCQPHPPLPICADFNLGHMLWKSNMNVNIVPIVSRTRMKRSAIRTLFIFAGIPGPVQPSRVITARFTLRPQSHARQIFAATAVRTFRAPTRPVRAFMWRARRTGRHGWNTYRACTSSASVIKARNSSARITSDST
jgi:hypothetical protein